MSGGPKPFDWDDMLTPSPDPEVRWRDRERRAGHVEVLIRGSAPGPGLDPPAGPDSEWLPVVGWTVFERVLQLVVIYGGEPMPLLSAIRYHSGGGTKSELRIGGAPVPQWPAMIATRELPGH